MQGDEAVPLNYTMLPEVLRRRGWSTHAIGKWNLGNLVKAYTPTFRGFDTFFGYYAAALTDYWYHGDPSAKRCMAAGNASLPGRTYFTDLSNSSGAYKAAGVRPGDAPGVNGTYDQELFTREAVRLIASRGAAQSMYIYLAYQNVHTTAQDKDTVSGAQPLHAPCKTVDELYEDTADDTFKVMGAMVTELDYGVGNVTRALKAGRDDWLVIFVSDNGGPINIASANAPLRGGKHTMWDGGLKVVSFVSGPLVPPAVRGSRWEGLACHADWLPTIAAGIANVSLPDRVVHFPRPMDGHNLWPAIVARAASPRTEIVHQVTNGYVASQKESSPRPPTIRMGDMKLILGDPGDDRIVSWPERASVAVPFGRSNGTRDAYETEQAQNLEHCRAPHPRGPVTPLNCQYNGCLFNVTADESESRNLINDTQFAAMVERMRRRLDEAGASGGPWAWPIDAVTSKSLQREICDEESRTGFIEPVHTSAPPTPPTPPKPVPPWAPCIEALAKHCPCSNFKTAKACEACGDVWCNRTITIVKYCSQDAPHKCGLPNRTEGQRPSSLDYVSKDASSI